LDCGVGEAGEIYVESQNIAHGYMGDEALSAERFSDLNDGYRRYRTGDLGIYVDDTQVKSLGRSDAQVNIRGFRVELGEIEAQLLQLPQIKSAVVLAPEQKQLVAFVIVEGVVADFNRLVKNALKDKLPDYMVPSVLIEMDAFPLNANGKIDQRALIQGHVKGSGNWAGDDYVAPQNQTEAKQVQVWAECLDLSVEQVSVTANFFELGGNSLSLLKLIGALKAQGVDRTIKQFYESPTIRGMSATPSESNDETQTLVKLNNTTKGTPLFVFHAIGGRVLGYQKLAKALEGICPVIGVQAPFNFSCDLSFDSILELAHYYQAAIKRKQPIGPYRLCGWSAGGVVAHRVAHVLTEQGDDVDYLAILDSTLHRNEALESLQRYQCLEHALKYAFGEEENIPEVESVLAQLPLDFKNMDYPQQLEVAVELLGEGALADYADKEQLIMALKFFVNLIKADRPLTPVHISGKAVLFKALLNKRQQQVTDGWHSSILSSNKVVEVTAEHTKMLEGECFERIVETLRDELST
ncbi:MAG: AMP-binding protein, partial [Algicola sp.]|nr:AMP-binding protein [Algicola sp.]